jgi:hemerythrin
MSLIRWNDSLRLDVTEIDQQHRRLVDMTNEVSEAIRQGKSKERLGKTLQSLLAYAGTHFKIEESHFERLGYPEAEKHKAEHAAFVRKVVEFKHSFEAGKLGVATQLATYLGDWLQKHIKGSDRKYAAYFHEKGVK